MTHLEKEMADCDKAVDGCARCYLGISYDEYTQKVGNVGHQLQSLPLPPGFADAAELRARLLTLKKSTPEAQRLKELEAQLEAMQKVLRVVGAQGLPHAMSKAQRRLLAEREQLERQSREQSQHASMAQWAFLMPNGAPVVVVDGVRFRAELSQLLRRKLELLCEHRLAVAERIIEVGGRTVARDPAFAERVNAAAERFQARIAGVGGANDWDWGCVSNMIAPLRHEYAWHAHFPSLVERIPESMPSNSNGSPTQFLLELSAAIEKDRAAALALA